MNMNVCKLAVIFEKRRFAMFYGAWSQKGFPQKARTVERGGNQGSYQGARGLEGPRRK